MGGGGLFKISGPQVVDLPAAVAVEEPGHETSWSALPGDILSKERKGWGDIWGRHPGAEAPWRVDSGRAVGPPLPPLTPLILREAARSFPIRKGFCGFCARWFAYVSDELLQCLCVLLEACERMGMWPGALMQAILHLIPKRGGGKRPIGLVDGICRLWERARRDLVRQWRLDHTRVYDYGAKGRQSTGGVGLVAIRRGGGGDPRVGRSDGPI